MPSLIRTPRRETSVRAVRAETTYELSVLDAMTRSFTDERASQGLARATRIMAAALHARAAFVIQGNGDAAHIAERFVRGGGGNAELPTSVDAALLAFINAHSGDPGNALVFNDIDPLDTIPGVRALLAIPIDA